MRLLEEFWYGNIEPTEYNTSSKEYKKLQDLICWNEKAPSHHDRRAKRVIREIHRLCARVSDHHGLTALPEQLWVQNDVGTHGKIIDHIEQPTGKIDRWAAFFQKNIMSS